MTKSKTLLLASLIGLSYGCGAESAEAESVTITEITTAPQAAQLAPATARSAPLPAGEGDASRGGGTEYCWGKYLRNLTPLFSDTDWSLPVEISRICSGKYTVTLSKSLTNTYSADVSVSAAEVSAGVRYSVESAFTLSRAYEISIPTGQCYRIRAYPTFFRTGWQVWERNCLTPDRPIGYGHSDEYVGLNILPPERVY